MFMDWKNIARISILLPHPPKNKNTPQIQFKSHHNTDDIFYRNRKKSKIQMKSQKDSVKAIKQIKKVRHITILDLKVY